MKIEVATKEDYENFAFEALDDTDWELVYSNKYTKVWTKQSKDSNLNTVRVSSIFENIKPEELIDEIYAEKNSKDLEGMVEESTVLEVLDKNNTISYCKHNLFNILVRLSSPIPFVSSRDFVTRRSVRKSPTECIVMLKSVEYESKPVESGCVRGDTQINGYYCIPNENGSNLIYLTRSDLGGYIPSWMINTIAQKIAPSLMEDLRRVIQKNYESK